MGFFGALSKPAHNNHILPPLCHNCRIFSTLICVVVVCTSCAHVIYIQTHTHTHEIAILESAHVQSSNHSHISQKNYNIALLWVFNQLINKQNMEKTLKFVHNTVFRFFSSVFINATHNRTNTMFTTCSN